MNATTKTEADAWVHSPWTAEDLLYVRQKKKITQTPQTQTGAPPAVRPSTAPVAAQ
jgi:hypothetical protein